MAGEVGNDYWRRRLKDRGPPRAYENAEDLLDDCLEYLEWVDANPLFEDKPMSSRDGITHETITKMRVPTIQGLTTHLGIHRQTWNKWRDNREDLHDVMCAIDNAMEAIQLEGASAGLLNGQIISRLIGLVDKTENKGVTLNKDVSDMSTEEIKNALKDIFATEENEND